MPRAKKKTESVLNQNTFVDVLDDEAPVETPTVREKHTVVTQWVQNKPLGSDAIADSDTNDEDDENFIDDLAADDPIAEVVEEMAESSLDWSLTVYRLPSFEENGKAGAGYKKFCGSIPVPSPSWLRHQQHLEEIQRRFARNGESNYFKIEARKGNRIKKELGVVAVEPLPTASVPGVALPVDANGSTINVYGNQQNPLDMMEAFTKQFATFQKLQNAMLPPWAKNIDPTAITQQPASVVPNTTEGALMTLLNSDDQLLTAATSKLRKLLKGGDDAQEEKSVWDFLTALVTSPTLPQTIQAAISQFRPQPGQANQPTDTAPPTVPPDVAAYQRLLGMLVQAMRLNAPAQTALAALDGFTALFPEHQASVESFLSLETPQLLQMLAQTFPPAAEAVALPHATEWVDKLKAAYFGESDEPTTSPA